MSTKDNKKKPLVSVIMPCFNAASFIDRAIQSICNQTYDNIELVCVDDGSADNTAEIIDKYCRQHNIKLIKQINHGVLKARRTAINASDGEYIVLCDADDTIETTAIEKSVNIVLEQGCDVVAWEFYSDNGTSKKPLLTYSKELECISGLEAVKQTLPTWQLTGIGLFKKEIYQKAYSIYDNMQFESFNSDEFVTRAAFISSEKVAKAKIKYFYYFNEESATKKFKLDWPLRLVTNKAIYELICRRNLLAEFKESLVTVFVDELISLRRSYSANKNNLTPEDRKKYVSNCISGFRGISFGHYLYWLFNSGRSLKNKTHFALTVLYFYGQ